MKVQHKKTVIDLLETNLPTAFFNILVLFNRSFITSKCLLPPYSSSVTNAYPVIIVPTSPLSTLFFSINSV